MGEITANDIERWEKKCKIENLITALGDREVRELAAEALGNMGDPRAAEPLAPYVANLDRNMQRAAEEALGKLGDPAIDAVASLLKDNQQQVRWDAIRVLERIGDPRAVEALISCLEDEDEDVRKYAAEALEKIGESKATPPEIATETAGASAPEELPADPEPMAEARLVPDDIKDEALKWIDKAAACTDCDYGRIAEVLAEVGERQGAVDMLERAYAVSSDVQDPVSADTALIFVAKSFVKAGSLLGDQELFERGLGLVSEMHGAGAKGVALARMFGYLSERNDKALAASVKKELMSQMDSLSSFEYSLTVGEVVKTLSKSPATKDEVATLLETSLERSKSDELFGDTAARDAGISYASAARALADRDFIERALTVSERLGDAEDRVAIYQDVAVAYAALGLHDEARRYLDKAEQEVDSIQDSWHRERAETDCLVARVVVGVISGDSALQEEGMKTVEDSDDKDLALAFIFEALMDDAKSKDDPAVAATAGQVADRFEKPFDRDGRLADRVGILCRSGRRDDAQALITRAISDVGSVSDPISLGRAYLDIAEAILQAA